LNKVEQLPGKAPFSQRFEEAVGQACEGAPARQVARRFYLAETTVRAIDPRYLRRWAAARRKPALRQMGVDEIHLGKKQGFVTVTSNLETGEPLWFGAGCKKETLDAFFRDQLSRRQRRRIEAACVDMWAPYRVSIEVWAPRCRIVYGKFHVMQHANAAVDEVRRAEFFRRQRQQRDLVRGRRWLLRSGRAGRAAPGALAAAAGEDPGGDRGGARDGAALEQAGRGDPVHPGSVAEADAPSRLPGD
jgi:hypothetical protein